MALTATMFLATAATLYVVAQDLPKTEQLHKMDKLLLGTLGMIFATGAESIAVFLLHKTNVVAAQALEHFVSVSLPAACFLLNAVLFGRPAVQLWFHGSHPKKILEERAFISWDEIPDDSGIQRWGQTADIQPWATTVLHPPPILNFIPLPPPRAPSSSLPRCCC